MDDADVSEARGRGLALGLHGAPGAGGEAELVEVVEPLAAVVAPEQVQAPLVLHHAVVLTHPGARAVVLDLGPRLYFVMDM